MKKKLMKLAFLACVLGTVTMLTGCGTPVPLGCLYAKVTLPVSVGNGDIKYNRIGEAKCQNFLGWIAIGDASINAACANGQINRVSWVSQRVENILGIYGTFTTIVYGFGDSTGADSSVSGKHIVYQP